MAFVRKSAVSKKDGGKHILQRLLVYIQTTQSAFEKTSTSVEELTTLMLDLGQFDIDMEYVEELDKAIKKISTGRNELKRSFEDLERIRPSVEKLQSVLDGQNGVTMDEGLLEEMENMFGQLHDRLGSAGSKEAIDRVQQNLTEVTSQFSSLEQSLSSQISVPIGDIQKSLSSLGAAVEDIHLLEELNESVRANFDIFLKVVLENLETSVVLQGDLTNAVTTLENLEVTLSTLTEDLSKFQEMHSTISTISEEVSKIQEMSTTVHNLSLEVSQVRANHQRMDEQFSHLAQLITGEVQQIKENQSQVVSEAVEVSMKTFLDSLAGSIQEVVDQEVRKVMTTMKEDLFAELGTLIDSRMALFENKYIGEQQALKHRLESIDQGGNTSREQEEIQALISYLLRWPEDKNEVTKRLGLTRDELITSERGAQHRGTISTTFREALSIASRAESSLTQEIVREIVSLLEILQERMKQGDEQV